MRRSRSRVRASSPVRSSLAVARLSEFPLGIPQQAEETYHRGSACLSEKPLDSPTPYQRFSRRVVHLAEKLVGAATDNERSRNINEGSGYIAVVQRQWREVSHPDLFYLGYGQENNALHYKWHLGLIGAEVSLYRLPDGQDKPVVGEWVHLAGTYNGETGKMSLYVNGKPIGTQTHVGEIRLDPESLNRPLAIGAELNGPSIDDPSNGFTGYVQTSASMITLFQTRKSRLWPRKPGRMPK